MFETFLRPLSELIRSDRLKETLCAIQASDRRSSFSAYHQTARLVQGLFEKMGLDEVERVDLPADGKTTVGDWIMPLAWDADEGVLELIGEKGEVGEELARYTKLPDHLILGSAPTPPEGVTAELRLSEEPTDIDGTFRAKIALVNTPPSSIKRTLHDAGALGLISYYHPAPEEDLESVYWNNTWSDRSSGWWATAQDCPLWGFSISPAAGRRLAQRLSSGERLWVRATIRSRSYEGTLPWISGLLKGATHPEEEILVLGHLYERGAHDNASGCAAILEVARAVTEGIAADKLKRPARTLRFLLLPECYGSMAYLERHRDRLAKTVAAVNLDGLGAGWPFEMLRGPDVAQTLLASLMLETAKAVWPEKSGSCFSEGGYDVCDNLIGDPLFGAPTIWPHRPSVCNAWHTSLDEPDRIDFESLRETSVCVGAFLLKMADFSIKEIDPLILLSRQRTERRIADLRREKDSGCYLEYEIETAERTLRQAERFLFTEDRAAAAGKLDRAANELKRAFSPLVKASPTRVDPHLHLDALRDRRVFRRTFAGIPSLDAFPDDELRRRGVQPTRWQQAALCAFWLVDGKREVRAIERLVALELRKAVSVVPYLELFLELGYLEET